MSGQNMFTRDDTFFGICEALGEDFGINPNWLRLAFCVTLLMSPLTVLGVYFGLGAIVLLSRLIVRNPRPQATVEAADAADPQAEAKVELPLAA